MSHLVRSRIHRTCIAVVALIVAGCATQPSLDMRVQMNEPKHIFVFMDGTRNNAYSRTNVRKLYEDLSRHADEKAAGKNTVTLYIEGVGDARHRISGPLVGKGKNYRIVAAYAELLKIYRPGDHIYIFGFSRGAQTARALAGLLSYAGIPELPAEPRTPQDYREIADEINELTKKKSDRTFRDHWAMWKKDDPPPLSRGIKERLVEMKIFSSMDSRIYPVQVAFLGVWDTVPGSRDREYGPCVERSKDDADKYKTHSYPTIKHIAHAVSNDEKQSKFQLLHVCKPIKPETIVKEVVFPGAHSDVGGGYDDVRKEDGAVDYEALDKLPTISMTWMLQELSQTYNVPRELIKKYRDRNDSSGIAHWSHSGLAHRLTSKCKNRDFKNTPDRQTPNEPESVQWDEHPSIDKRKKKGVAPIKETGSRDPILSLTYPLSCEDYEGQREEARRLGEKDNGRSTS